MIFFRPKYNTYNRIEINKAALLYNFDFFAEQTSLQVIPVLKANAYGHGLDLITQILKKRDFPYIAVDGYFEAAKIRKISNQPILVMGMIKPVNFKFLRLRNISLVVQDLETIKTLGRLNKKIKIHLEINTGMNRYGIKTSELDRYLKLIKSYPKLELEGVMTHLADADGTDNKNIEKPVKEFDQAVSRIISAGFKPKLLHIGQSAGSLRAVSRYANCARIGLGLYGINPFAETHPFYSKCQNLRPVLSFVSTICKVNSLDAGEKISYNYTFTAKKSMRIGVLPVGYHEGVDRILSNRGTVSFGKINLPIVGRVCMNHTMVDLGELDAKEGDEVKVISNIANEQTSVENIAKSYGLFTYSLLTGLSPDVRRILV